jgi:hypothetical protein
MDADRQIELAGFLIDRKKMGVADVLIAFQAAHEYTAGAILLGVARFFDRFVHRKQRQHRHPAQPFGSLLPDIDQPSIVTSRHRQLDLGTSSKGTKEDRRIQNLHVDVQVVHMLEPRPDVRHLPGLSRGVMADIACLSDIRSIDQPRFAARCRIVGSGHDARFKCPFRFQHVVPRVLCL